VVFAAVDVSLPRGGYTLEGRNGGEGWSHLRRFDSKGEPVYFAAPVPDPPAATGGQGRRQLGSTVAVGSVRAVSASASGLSRTGMPRLRRSSGWWATADVVDRVERDSGTEARGAGRPPSRPRRRALRPAQAAEGIGQEAGREETVTHGHPADEQQRVRRAADLGGEQLRVERPDGDAGRGRAEDRDRREDPEPRSVAEEERGLHHGGEGGGPDRHRPAPPRLDQAAADDHTDQARHAVGDRPEHRDVEVREAPVVGQEPVRELRRRGAEHPGEEGDASQEREARRVRTVAQRPHPPTTHRIPHHPPVAPGLGERAHQRGQQEQHRPAHAERDPPRLGTEVGDGQEDHDSAKPAPLARQIVAAYARAVRGLLHHGDAGHDDRDLHEGPHQELGAGEEGEVRGQGGRGVGEHTPPKPTATTARRP